VEATDGGKYMRAGVQLQGNLTYSFTSVTGPIAPAVPAPAKSAAPFVVKRGASCSILNLKKKVGKIFYTCRKSSTGKLAWK
jgi:hypothetical protein